MNNINKNIIEIFYDFLENVNNIDNYEFNQCSKYLNKIISETHTKKYILKKTLALKKLMLSKQENKDIAEFIYSLNKSKLKVTSHYEYYVFKNNNWILLDFESKVMFVNEQMLYLSEFMEKIPYSQRIYGARIPYPQRIYGARIPYPQQIYGARIPYPQQIYGARIPYLKMDNTKYVICQYVLKILTNDINKNLTQKIFDQDENIIGFQNGTYNLSNNHFRISFPIDNISKTVEYNFPIKYSDKKDNLLNFLKDIQPNETLRNYLLEQTAECLNVKDNKLLIFIGECAGISTYIKLINDTFGCYSMMIICNDKCNIFLNGEYLNKKIIILKDFLDFNTKDSYKLSDYIKSRNYMQMHTRIHNTTIINWKFKPDTNGTSEEEKKRIHFIDFPTRFVVNPVKPNEKKRKEKIFSDCEYKFLISDFMLLLIEIYRRKYG